MSLPVFQNGSWISYPLPKQIDPLWSQSHLFKAAAVYASALSLGFSTHESAVLAECAVYKEVFPELEYPKQIERKLQRLRVTREQHETP